MYTAVLAAALMTTSATPDFHRRCGGCYAPSACHHGCYGCAAYSGGAGLYGVSAGASGAWTADYWGGVYSGHGGYVGCYGYYGYGYPVHGYVQVPYGAAANGPYAARYAQFSAVPLAPLYLGCTGCYGAYGGYSGYGIPVAVELPAARPPEPEPKTTELPPINPKDTKEPELVPAPKNKKAPEIKDGTEPKKQKVDDKKKAKTSLPQAAGRALVRIDVPQGGKLFVDGQHVAVAPGIRMFQTPALTPGQTFYYDVRLDMTANGVVQRAERRILVNAGEDIAVNFENLRPLGTATASR